MTFDLMIGEHIKQLRRVGMRPPERLVRDILGVGDAAYERLLELATSTDLLHREPPECYAPIHALRLLGEIPRVAMIEPLLRTLPLERHYAEEEEVTRWLSELPQIIGRVGAAAVEPLWAIADDESWGVAGRTAALIALANVTAVAPETRDETIAALRERLAQADDKLVITYIVRALGDLGDQDSYATVMRLYREGKVDQRVLSAGAARQLLLAQRESTLECTLHSLWERYDQHGPFEEDELG